MFPAHDVCVIMGRKCKFWRTSETLVPYACCDMLREGKRCPYDYVCFPPTAQKNTGGRIVHK